MFHANCLRVSYFIVNLACKSPGVPQEIHIFQCAHVPYVATVLRLTFQMCSLLRLTTQVHRSQSALRLLQCLHDIPQGQTVKVLALCTKWPQEKCETTIRLLLKGHGNRPPLMLEGCYQELRARNKLLAVNV